MINFTVKRFFKILERQVTLVEARARAIEHDKITTEAALAVKAHLPIDKQLAYLALVLDFAKNRLPETRYYIYREALYSFRHFLGERVRCDILHELSDAFRPFVRAMLNLKAFPHLSPAFALYEALLQRAPALSRNELKTETVNVARAVDESITRVLREHPGLTPEGIGG